MAGPLDGKKILILATNGFEQAELEVPRDKLKAAGARVDVVSPEQREIKGWAKKDWGRPVKVDKALKDAKVDDYDAIVLPGGQINPDLLRVNADALQLIRGFYDAGKTVAAVCHAPWLLIETGIAKGRKMTSYHSIKTDVINAGAQWEDREVVTDNGVVTSRNPGDLEAFQQKNHRGGARRQAPAPRSVAFVARVSQAKPGEKIASPHWGEAGEPRRGEAG